MTSNLQNLFSFLLILLGVIVLPLRTGGHLSPRSSTEVPQGWYVYADNKLKNANEYDRRCFNLSHREWKVTVEGDTVQITEKSRVQDETPSLPPRLVHQQGMTKLRSATRFDDEWLLAYDAGEFGGGLWLSNHDGSDVRRIFNSDVRAVVPSEDGVLILSGLAHMTFDSGDASFFSLPHAMNMTFQFSIKLDGAPSAYAQETDGSVIFATTHSLCRVTKTGGLQILHAFPRWIAQQYPNSMAIAADGSIYIGMRMFVLKLNDKVSTYSEEWLLPKECRKFDLDLAKINCACKP
jgi:hypothetical protein